MICPKCKQEFKYPIYVELGYYEHSTSIIEEEFIIEAKGFYPKEMEKGSWIECPHCCLPLLYSSNPEKILKWLMKQK